MTSEAAKRHVAVRVVQAALVAGAVLLGSGWADAAEVVATTGRDALALALEAPVVEDKGPWVRGDVLTEDSAGLDVDVAPLWRVTARHHAAGVDLESGPWKVEARIQKVSGDGRLWWSVAEPLPVEAAGDVASFALDAATLVHRATALDEASKTPGRLDVVLVVAHDAVVVVDGAPNAATRTATLALSPSGSVVSFTLVEDTADWSTVAEHPPPWASVLLLVSAAALEAPARVLLRRVPPWERARGVAVVDAVVPPVARDAPRCDLATALATARRTGSVVLVDRAKNVAVVQGAVQLVADLDPTPVDLEIVPRAPAATRPLTPLSEVFRAPEPGPEVAFEVAGEASVPPIGRFVPFREERGGTRRAR